MHLRHLILALCLGVLPAVNAQQALPPLQPIPSLDLPRYMGTWHEIARYPNRFQHDCARNTRAEYVALEDGTVQVTNRCETAEGKVEQAVGVARLDGPAGSAALRVRFAPKWLSFLGWVWGRYWVIDLDSDYRLAAVSEPGRDYLWVLSRTPEVDPAAYAALRQRLQQQGFDLQRLQVSPQGPGS